MNPFDDSDQNGGGAAVADSPRQPVDRFDDFPIVKAAPRRDAESFDDFPIVKPAPRAAIAPTAPAMNVQEATQPIAPSVPSFDYTTPPQNGAAGIFPVDQNPAQTYQQDVQQYLQTPGGIGMMQQRQRVPNVIQGGYDQVIAQPQGLPLTGSNGFVSTPGPSTAGLMEGESPLNKAARRAADQSGDPRYLEHAAMVQAMNEAAAPNLPSELTGDVRMGAKFAKFDPSDLPADFIQKSKQNQQALANPNNVGLKVPNPWLFELPDGSYAVDVTYAAARYAKWWNQQQALKGAEDDVTPEQQSAQLDQINAQRRANPYPAGLRQAMPADQQGQIEDLKAQAFALPRGKNTASEDVLNLPGATAAGVKKVGAGLLNMIGDIPLPDWANFSPPSNDNLFHDTGEALGTNAAEQAAKNPIDRPGIRMITQVPQIAGAFGASAVGGPAGLAAYGGAMAAGNTYQDIYDEVHDKAMKRGLSDEQARELAHSTAFGPAAVSGITGAIISQLRLTADDPAAGLIANTVRHALAGGSIGMVQDTVDQVAKHIGYSRPIDVEEIFNAGLDNAILSAATHLGVKGAQAAGRTRAAGRSASPQPVYEGEVVGDNPPPPPDEFHVLPPPNDFVATARFRAPAESRAARCER